MFFKKYQLMVNFPDLIIHRVMVNEADLFIRTNCNKKKFKEIALSLLLKCKYEIGYYLDTDEAFKKSCKPYRVKNFAPCIVKEMAEKSAKVTMNPMASFSGAVVEYVGKGLFPYAKEIIIENDGSIFLKSAKKRKINIFSEDIFSHHRLAIEIAPEEEPIGICVSTVTPMNSKIVIISNSTPLAKATVTFIENMLIGGKKITQGLEFASNIEGIKGALVIQNNYFGIWGKVKLVGG